MKKALISMFLLVAGCQSTSRMGLQEQTGFKELPFPSNSLSPAQIVEICVVPEEKVELTYDPNMPKNCIRTSPGWDITIEEKRKLEVGIEIRIQGILKSVLATDSDRTVKVSFTDTRTSLIPKANIYSALKLKMEENADGVKDLLSKYMADGMQFDVITATLTATVSYEIMEMNSDSLAIGANPTTMIHRKSSDEEELSPMEYSLLTDKLKTDYGFNATYDSQQNKAFLGKNLVIGIHRDSRMVYILMDN